MLFEQMLKVIHVKYCSNLYIFSDKPMLTTIVSQENITVFLKNQYQLVFMRVFLIDCLDIYHNNTLASRFFTLMKLEKGSLFTRNYFLKKITIGCDAFRAICYCLRINYSEGMPVTNRNTGFPT